MPRTGRLAYKLLPPEYKTLLDKFVQNLLQENRYLAQMVEDYVEAKMAWPCFMILILII